MKVLQVCSFFSDRVVLTVLGNLYLHTNVIISFFLQKCLLKFGWDYSEYINQFGDNWHLNDMESSDPYIKYISPFILDFFNFSQQ